MATMSWAKNPIEVVQGYETRHGQTPLSPLFLWAVWAVEGLFYLDDLDAGLFDSLNKFGVHNLDIIDIAHVRWATGTAITALDLCSAGLGRKYCGWTGKNELDLRNFDLQKDKKRAPNLRSALPNKACSWVNDVLADARYKNIQGARNPFTHSWMNRHLISGGPVGHESRTQFKLIATNCQLGARTLVSDSRDLSSEYVNKYLQLVDTL